MRAYSIDLRERIVRAVAGGLSQAAAARVYAVSVRTVQRYLALQHAGSLAPKPIPGRRREIGPDDEAALRAQVAAAPDATLEEHCAQWARERRAPVSVATMSRALQRLGWPRKKKSLGASERDEAARAGWREAVAAVDPATLVFADESGTNLAMTRRYARAPRGARAHAAAPRNPGTNTTLIAALSLAGAGAAMTLPGAVDARAFAAYVREVLAPTLVPGQTVVLDNLSVHRDAAVRRAIEARGCRLLFLPAYSPDLSPIELAFAKLKEALRRAAARTQEALEAAIAAALETITAADARGWFRHCGYRVPRQSL